MSIINNILNSLNYCRSNRSRNVALENLSCLDQRVSDYASSSFSSNSSSSSVSSNYASSSLSSNSGSSSVSSNSAPIYKGPDRLTALPSALLTLTATYLPTADLARLAQSNRFAKQSATAAKKQIPVLTLSSPHLQDEDLVKILGEFSRLERLQISNCPQLTGAGIRSLAQNLQAQNSLTHLSIEGCYESKITVDDWKMLMTSLNSNLKTLHFPLEKSGLKKEEIDELIKHIPVSKLTELTFDFTTPEMVAVIAPQLAQNVHLQIVRVRLPRIGQGLGPDQEVETPSLSLLINSLNSPALTKIEIFAHIDNEFAFTQYSSVFAPKLSQWSKLQQLEVDDRLFKFSPKHISQSDSNSASIRNQLLELLASPSTCLGSLCQFIAQSLPADTFSPEEIFDVVRGLLGNTPIQAIDRFTTMCSQS